MSSHARPVSRAPLAIAPMPRTISWRPGRLLLDRLFRTHRPDVAQVACERWQIAPGCRCEVRRAKYLPGQLERIAGSEFGSVSEVVYHFRGGFEAVQSPTMAYLLKDALLHDGVLHAGNAVRHLRRRSHLSPVAFAPREESRLALYESWLGNRWFGNWLSDDCLTYRLAEEAGTPVTTGGSSGHMPDYERSLGMNPARSGTVHCRELVVFDDAAHNEHKRARAEDMRRRLVRRPVERHPGVFLLRGRSGDPRVLLNEAAIAERLAIRHGFRLLDPGRATVAEIAAACGGARIVAGLEGSHLVHGLMTMPADACAFVIQPPMRAVSALKMLTDRQGQDYALVVAKGTNDALRADIDEIERTLDLV